MIAAVAGCNAPYGPDEFRTSGCVRCHTVKIDAAHDIGCVSCHQGNPGGKSPEAAHTGMTVHPASPTNMEKICGRCHMEYVRTARTSGHFTLNREIGGVWRTFFPASEIPVPTLLKKEEYPRSLQGLVADMLVKRCLRCHVWYEGDDYSGTRRGTGCAACHLQTASGGNPLDHKFRKGVSDERCLSCHYGNFVGWDYYGRFEKDFPAEFRAPLKNGRHIPRPYGVEWLDMTPDVHRRRGMTCTACHTEAPCRVRGSMPTCISCHEPDSLSGENPGHSAEDAGLVACTVCHALWAPADTGRSLTRLDTPDYGEWLPLSVQNSSEVEMACREESQYPFGSWGTAYMLDKIDGTMRPGMWFEGFIARRFWPVIIGETRDGRLVNVRPLLDISISYLDGNDDIMADNVKPAGDGTTCMDNDQCVERIAAEILPDNIWISFLDPEILKKPGLWLSFTPHTVGHADVFRSAKVSRWLKRRLMTRHDN